MAQSEVASMRRLWYTRGVEAKGTGRFAFLAVVSHNLIL